MIANLDVHLTSHNLEFVLDRVTCGEQVHDMYIYIQTEILPNLNHGTCGYDGSAYFLFSLLSKASFFLRTGICSEKSVLGCWVSLNLGLSAIRGKDICENECWVVGSAFF